MADANGRGEERPAGGFQPRRVAITGIGMDYGTASGGATRP
jgi:hypothetical protein